MDEILIGDKKYVSSKQAAKVTGYAKDYVGQLCREGRVPARLVGRSWYVLESALQDHRFGDRKTEQESTTKTRPVDERTSSLATWASPRYEASEGEVLPQTHRSSEEESAEPEQADETNMVEHLQDSWRAWFDHIGATKETVPNNREEQKEEVVPVPEAEVVETNDAEKEVSSVHDTNVPIHVVYEPPPSDLLPENAHQKQAKVAQTLQIEEETPVPQARLVGLMARTGIAIGCIVALSTAALAVINSGYLDKYIYSFEQVNIITGMHLYNK